MAYVTHEEIEARMGTSALVQVADDDGDNLPDAAVVEEARRAAEGELESYVGRRYRLPLPPVVSETLNGALRSAVLDLVEWRLRTRRPPVSAEVLRRAAETREWLRRIAAGELSLPGGEEVPTSGTHGTVAKVSGEPRRLSRRELEGV